MARSISKEEEAKLDSLKATIEYDNVNTNALTDDNGKVLVPSRSYVLARLRDKDTREVIFSAEGGDKELAKANVLATARPRPAPAALESALDAERTRADKLQAELEAIRASNTTRGTPPKQDIPPPMDEKQSYRELLQAANITEGWDGRSSIETLKKLVEENELLPTS